MVYGGTGLGVGWGRDPGDGPGLLPCKGGGLDGTLPQLHNLKRNIFT